MGTGERVGMVSLWVVVVVVMGMMESGAAQMVNVEDSLTSLDNCDFRFKGHKSIPPIFNLQNPGLNALSSSVITRDGKALLTAATGKLCGFPEGDGGESEEVAAVCAEHFHMELDKMVTTTVPNVTEWVMTGLKGRHVTLPLTVVDLIDGTQLREGDGNLTFPESRRCVSFFTASDITALLDKVLNKAHRKKLSKISLSAQRFRSDFNALLNNILQFPQ